MKLRQLKTGEVFELAGYEWILLEHDEKADKSLVITKECVAYMPFDEDNSNDFRDSTLRKFLNSEFSDDLIFHGLGEDGILYTVFDLSDSIGGGNYGFCRDKVGLLTIEQYRKHEEILALNDEWWLITPSASVSDNVRVVFSGEAIGSGRQAYYCSLGVRPALYLKSDVRLPVDKETSLEDYSSVELLQELRRRETEQIQRANRTRRS